jgi:hypothetical protein
VGFGLPGFAKVAGICQEFPLARPLLNRQIDKVSSSSPDSLPHHATCCEKNPGQGLKLWTCRNHKHKNTSEHHQISQ